VANRPTWEKWQRTSKPRDRQDKIISMQSRNTVHEMVADGNKLQLQTSSTVRVSSILADTPISDMAVAEFCLTLRKDTTNCNKDESTDSSCSLYKSLSERRMGKWNVSLGFITRLFILPFIHSADAWKKLFPSAVARTICLRVKVAMTSCHF
jgi:hypothetical protein